MIEPGDLDRLVSEIVAALGDKTEGLEIKEWLAENQISEQAINDMTHILSLMFVRDLLEDREVDPLQAVAACSMHAFMIGWEAQKQYGRRGTVKKKTT